MESDEDIIRVWGSFFSFRHLIVSLMMDPYKRAVPMGEESRIDLTWTLNPVHIYLDL